MGGVAEIELEAAEGRRTLGLAGDVRDRDVLTAERLSDADLAAAADERPGGGGLAEDVVGSDAGGVETVLNREIEAKFLGGGGG